MTGEINPPGNGQEDLLERFQKSEIYPDLSEDVREALEQAIQNGYEVTMQRLRVLLAAQETVNTEADQFSGTLVDAFMQDNNEELEQLVDMQIKRRDSGRTRQSSEEAQRKAERLQYEALLNKGKDKGSN